MNPTPTTRFSRIVSARYRPAADTDWTNEVDFGDLHDESTVEYELPDEDRTTGDEPMYAGEFLNATIRSFDLSKYADLRTEYKADNRIDVELTLEESDTLLVEEVLPRTMMDPVSGGPGNRNTFSTEIRKFAV